jgi:hypothetical protein
MSICQTLHQKAYQNRICIDYIYMIEGNIMLLILYNEICILSLDLERRVILESVGSLIGLGRGGWFSLSPHRFFGVKPVDLSSYDHQQTTYEYSNLQGRKEVAHFRLNSNQIICELSLEGIYCSLLCS